MSTKIEWCDSPDGAKGETWNPTLGCSRVSEGCRNCYAERVAHRAMSPLHRGLTVIRGGRPGWTGEVRLVSSALGRPLGWKKPRRIFVNSMSDLFHERVPFDFVAAVFGVMAACPHHTFLVLTKRPEIARQFFVWAARNAPRYWCAVEAAKHVAGLTAEPVPPFKGWPLSNVHLGVSAEDQETFDERVPLLLRCDAAVRWVSAEPLLGPIDVRSNQPEQRADGTFRPMIDDLSWIVVGGESGPGARPFDIEWGRAIVRQCRAARVPVFVKQLGAFPYREKPAHPHDVVTWMGPLKLADRKGGDPSEWPADLRVRELPEVHRG